MKVLIVDDDEDIRDMLRHMATRNRMKSYEAADGAEAIDILHRKGHKIQAAIIDLDMPKMNGLELLDHIKANHPNLVCALHTARDQATHPRADMIRVKPHGLSLMTDLQNLVAERQI
ncbi:TPA: hypothetical protein DF272_03705 [Candidatus Falkowbacteria bacterium]|nr:hypothetical protein [Candidatus Falkowbacteria bacterium]